MKSEDEITDILMNDASRTSALCRICLTDSTSECFPLFAVEGEVPRCEKVLLCTRVELEQREGLPSAICAPCSRELDLADSFRVKCELSDTLLRRILPKGLIKRAETEAPKAELIPVDAWIDSIGVQIKEELPDSLLADDMLLEFHVRKEKKRRGKKFSTALPPLPELDIEMAGSHGSIAGGFDSADDLPFPRVKKTKLEKKIKIKATCSLCSEAFTRKFLLKEHMKATHRAVKGRGAEKRFHCSECDYKTPYKKTLIYHIRTHTGEKPYICDVCSRGFAQPSSLIAHKRTHSDKMYYTCPECGRQFKYKQKFERHKLVHVKEKKFICTMCNKALKTQLTLNIHMNRHFNIKNYNCETCGSTFVTSSELINHVKIHTNQRDFHCTICEFKAYKKTGLEKHMKYHTGEKPFKCELCEQAFATRGEVRCHMRKHTKEKKYACAVCQQKFLHSPSLNRHMLRVHGIRFKWSSVVDRRIVK